jgi:hypothetical protein
LQVLPSGGHLSDFDCDVSELKRAFVALSQLFELRPFTAYRLSSRKILVEARNGEKCDEPFLRGDKATAYVMNTCDSRALSADACCESPIGGSIVHVTVRVRTTPARAVLGPRTLISEAKATTQNIRFAEFLIEDADRRSI